VVTGFPDRHRFSFTDPSLTCINADNALCARLARIPEMAGRGVATQGSGTPLVHEGLRVAICSSKASRTVYWSLARKAV